MVCGPRPTVRGALNMNETTKRILSGLVIATTIIVGLYFNDRFYGVFPLLFVSGFAFLGIIEYYTLVDKGYEGRPLKGLGLLFTFLTLAAFFLHATTLRAAAGMEFPPALVDAARIITAGGSVYALIFILFMISVLTLNLVFRPLDGTNYSVSTTVFGVVYAVIPISHALLILTMKNGVFYLVFFAVATVMTDTGAYFGGKFFGRHNAGLKVSPKKTYEGYVGGFIVALALSHFFVWGWKQYAFESVRSVPFGPAEITILSLFTSLISVFGDLVESAIKRDAKKKDSASLIPGHGGMLDLDDALLFSLPLAYYYLHYKDILGFAV